MSELAATVLVVDDDVAVGTVLETLLRQDGLQAAHVTSGQAALDVLERRPYEAVITDLRMPGMDGMTLLAEIKRRWPELPVVMLTAHGSVALAVEAMKAGAVEFVLKPFDREELLYVMRKALAASEATADDAPQVADQKTTILGSSPGMVAVREVIAKAAASDATVLIRGESGTGKELVARAVHEQSGRQGAPLIKVHSAALPDTLLESEVFGYEKGAFTGAVRRKPGRVELAEGGTLFLDEIGDITLAVQVKLLRLLQDREYERLGGTKTLSADARFVAATHRDLEAMLSTGEFREDLFYRLNVVTVGLPPLRDRGDDIGMLAQHFCAQLVAANGKPSVSLDPASLGPLQAHPWPGNVRQLQNMVERLVVMAEGDVIGVDEVQRELALQPAGPGEAASKPTESSETANAPLVPPIAPPQDGVAPEGRSLDEWRYNAEHEALVRTLKRCGNNRTQAARVLQVSRRTLYNKLQEHELV